jgi:hypothetical protein
MAKAAIMQANRLLSKIRRHWPRRTIVSAVAICALVLTLGNIAVAPKANAQDGEPICLYYAPTYCLQSHGLYNQVTISDSSYSYWTPTYADGGTMFQNDSGLCLREDNALNGEVVVGAACTASDDNDIWIETSTGIGRYYNLAVYYEYGVFDYLLVGNPYNGEPVYTGTPASGLWWGWVYGLSALVSRERSFFDHAAPVSSARSALTPDQPGTLWSLPIPGPAGSAVGVSLRVDGLRLPGLREARG